MSEKEDKKTVCITGREENLLQVVRSLGFGEIVIYVAEGQPVRVEEIKKSIKL